MNHASRWVFITASLFFSKALFADDLLTVYSQALKNDPVFAQAESTWQSQKMLLPIARSYYLPSFEVDASGMRNYQYATPPNQFGTFNRNTWQYGYTLTLTQPIFNAVYWSQIKGAASTAKSALATFFAAEQDLMQRTSTAYFAVLKAYDQLRFTIANKRAVWQQYLTAREQFRVGLIAITDEYEARARYDQVIAQQLADQNNLNVALENLRAITGHAYSALKALGKRLPLVKPTPANINQWVSTAESQNYQIKAQNFNVRAAMENIIQQAAGSLPAVSFGATYSDTETVGNPPNGLGVPNKTGLDVGNVGLNLTYKPIQGGYVLASTKKARFDYYTAVGLLEQTHRSVVNQTRSSFLGVLSYISKVKADKQTIISNKNAFSATEAGLKVGTRTMVDVLNSLTTLYQSQQQFASDQYAYINNLIALKVAAGTLSETDLSQINQWLQKTVTFSQQTKVESEPPANHTPAPQMEQGKTPEVRKNKKSIETEIPTKPTVTPPPIEPTAPPPAPPQSEEPALKKEVFLAPPREMMLPSPART